MTLTPGFLRIGGIKRYLKPLKIKTFDRDERDAKKFILAIIIKDDIKALGSIIGEGANPNAKSRFGGNPLYWAARYSNNINVIKALLDAGSNVNIQNKHGYAPLHEAAYRGNTEITKLLLERGAYVKIKNQYGFTPLDLAAMNDHTETSKLLITHTLKRDSQAEKPAFIKLLPRYSSLSQYWDRYKNYIETQYEIPKARELAKSENRRKEKLIRIS